MEPIIVVRTGIIHMLPHVLLAGVTGKITENRSSRKCIAVWGVESSI
jgi:hypothetical protein